MCQDICIACSKPLEIVESKFKDAVCMDVPGIGNVYYDIYLVVCASCGEVVDKQTYVSK